MKFSSFVFVLAIQATRASPSLGPESQLVLHDYKAAFDANEDARPVHELVLHSALDRYALRVAVPDPTLCDPSVKQHSGFLDISDDRHLFFWFFESRKAPLKAPLTLWLNGGPGGSSMMGLLFELGPCTIANEGENTIVNDHGWNTYSNLLFLDQPADVGYSYSSGGAPVDNSPVAAEDVYAFLQLFLSRYPEYESAPFHVAGESYGGTYVPHIVSEIHRRNKKLDVTDGGSPNTLRKDLKKIHLESRPFQNTALLCRVRLDTRLAEQDVNEVAVGVDPSLPFDLVNWEINKIFTDSGDIMRHSAALLPELINDGIRLLVYAGMADIACDYMGNEAWVDKLEHIFHEEFHHFKARPWFTIDSNTHAGDVRSAGGGIERAGNVTFVNVFEAGHMVPHDQPEAALDLFARWIFDIPLYMDNIPTHRVTLEDLIRSQ
ncbi:hypothetical protein EW026_g1309 [Hermanssonia centrifuga]|uniref:Carboxypeptidase n=1 Tax=Hermanssonia centrifuga TaxID=98765 RepID=A0A4S4KST6_9APHY|nr:hypothetical protein EW026_g1309 [Hermanssonia centrifuga]